jgi:tetratricopeptide (TPR) repeat protein
VNSRWSLSLTVLGFVVFVAALAIYMSYEEPPRPPVGARPPILDELASEDSGDAGISLREHFTKLRNARERASAERERLAEQPKPRRRKASPPWRERIGRLAEQIDETAVHLRSNVRGSPVAKLAAGSAAIQKGRPDAAIEEFDQILARKPADVAALSGKAAALVTMRRFDEASKVYAELVRIAPRDTTARYNFGVLLYRLSRFGEAAEQFRRLVETDPGHTRGQYNLATLAQRAGHLEEAREAWEAFTRLEPRAANGWFNLGVVWMDFNQPLEAVSCFSEFVGIRPEDADGWLNLGLAYAAAGHLEPALEAITRADAAAPCDGTIMRCLANLHGFLADQGGPEAERHRRAAISLEDEIKLLQQTAEDKQPVATGPVPSRP